MKIDANELKEVYVKKKKIIADDERFYAVPGTDREYVLSSYGRLYHLENDGTYQKIKLEYRKGKEVYCIRFPGEAKKYVSVQWLIKHVFYSKNMDCFLWNPHNNPFDEKRWKVDDLEILNGKEQILEALIAKMSGKKPDFDEYQNTHGFVYRKEFDKPLNKVIQYKYWGMRSRCNNPNVKAINPVYMDATLCQEWQENPESFAEWFVNNIYYYPGELNLDKDILSFGEKAEYSPDTCCLIPRYLNNIFERCEQAKLGYCITAKTRANGEKYYTVPGQAFAKYESDKTVIIAETYDICLIAARMKKAKYIRDIVEAERAVGYIPEKILAAMEEWANRCEKGLIKIWEPDTEKLRERGLI